MKHVIAAVLLVGCTQSENLGDRFVLHAARWAMSAGPAEGDANATLVAVDSGGDVIGAGSFIGTVDFGTTTLATDLMSPAYWLGKRSGLDGSEQWTVPLSGTNFAVTALAVDASRDVIIGGGYTGDQTFGSQVLSTPQQDAYVAMLGPDGAVKWAAGLAPYSQAFADSIAVVGGRIYMTASSPAPSTPGFAAAYTLDGTELWHVSLSTKARVYATLDGRVMLAGVVGSSTSLGGTMIDLTRDPDLFMATIGTDGALADVATFGTLGVEHRDLYATPTADGDLAVTVNEFALPTSVPSDARVDTAGALRWNVAASDPAQSHAITAVGDVTVTAGHVTGRVFGSQVGAMYLAARDADGALVDARVFGDPSVGQGDTFTALATGPSGELAFAGYVDQAIDLGTGQLAAPGMAGQTNLVLGIIDPP